MHDFASSSPRRYHLKIMRVVVKLRSKWLPRNHRRGWLFVSAGGILVCMAVLQALAFREFTHVWLSGVRDTDLAPEILPADLVVSEAGFAGAGEQARLVGILKNRSANPYTDIQLTFSLVDRDGDTVGQVSASVDRIGGQETAKFEAPAARENVVQVVLQHIESRPPLAGAP